MDETMSQQLKGLENVLRQMAGEHEALATLIERKREALRRARHQAMDELTQLENEKLASISALERKRVQLAGELTGRLEPEAAQPLRVSELAERVSEPQRGRLLVLARELRERMKQVQHASSITRQASEALLKHVQGVVQSVGMLSTGVSTYSSGGAPTAGATAVRTLNLTA